MAFCDQAKRECLFLDMAQSVRSDALLESALTDESNAENLSELSAVAEEYIEKAKLMRCEGADCGVAAYAVLQSMFGEAKRRTGK